jgi:hypothetical protein
LQDLLECEKKTERFMVNHRIRVKEEVANPTGSTICDMVISELSDLGLDVYDYADEPSNRDISSELDDEAQSSADEDMESDTR